MDWARLRKISLFEDLSDEELQRFAVLAAEGSVHEGTELVHQGDFAYELFAIEEGTAEVRCDGEVVAELGPATSSGRSPSSSTTCAPPPWWPPRPCA